FDEPIDPTSFSLADITSFTTPNGSALGDIFSAVLGLDQRTVTVQFTPQKVRGDYQMTIGPDIMDLAGNAMAAPYTATIHVTGLDLAASAVSTTSNATFGDTITVNWIDSNVGEYPLTTGRTASIYLSKDGVLDVGDLLLKIQSDNTPLGVGQSEAMS